MNKISRSFKVLKRGIIIILGDSKIQPRSVFLDNSIEVVCHCFLLKPKSSVFSSDVSHPRINQVWILPPTTESKFVEIVEFWNWNGPESLGSIQTNQSINHPKYCNEQRKQNIFLEVTVHCFHKNLYRWTQSLLYKLYKTIDFFCWLPLRVLLRDHTFLQCDYVS